MQTPVQQAIDNTTAAVISTAAGTSAVVLAQQWAVALFGVPLFVVLAAFAGVFYGLTYREAMPPVTLWVSVVLTTLVAVAVTPLLAVKLAVPAAGLAGIAAVVGFLLQWMAPMLKKHRDAIFESLLSLLPGRRPPGGGQAGGGQP